MYKDAEEKINRGLSPLSRWLLAFISGLFGVGMFLMAPDSNAPLGFIAFGGFCVAIALVCVTKGRVRKFIGSIIGLVLFFFSLFYLYTQVTGGPISSGSRNKPSVINSLLFLLFFGLPGITFSLKAKFGYKNGSS